LAAALRQRDHNVLTIAPLADRSSSMEEDFVGVGRAVGIPANGSVAPIAFGPLAAAGIRRAIEGFQPDVLHLHEPLIPSLSLLALWKAGDVATVGTFHAAADSSAGYRVSRPILERAAKRLTVRTAVSDAARSLVDRYFPGDYLLTPNGVDVARFAEATPVDIGRGPTVLFFGRIERRKGLEVLIQACTRLRDLDVTLVVAGTGPEEKAARALADRLLVPTRFLGRVPDADVAGVYKAASVYCAPGLGGESFGIVLLEAMAAGTPIVCSSLPGFREVAAHAAAFVQPDQSGPLADALREVIGGWGEELVRKGSQRVGMFDWRRLVGGVELTYERALSLQGAATGSRF
jgi:phosphatidylinositol alpha-mannosyltransferase